MIDCIVELAKTHIWNGEVKEEEFLGSAPTMLSNNERRMLHWLAREVPLEDGCIVDAGCFLGGSTLALATGLAKSKNTRNKDWRIYSYDMFIAPRDKYSLGLIGKGKKAGDNVVDIFVDHLGEYQTYIMVNKGDFNVASPPPRNIDILFVDICKTWELNDIVVSRFFPLMVPGKSLLIQQDYNDHSCPWVNLTMQYFKNYFQVICDDHGSRVFLYKKQIPASLLQGSLSEKLSPKEQIALMDDAVVTSSSSHSRYFNAVTKSWILFENFGLAVAEEYLSNIENVAPQPWNSKEPYTVNVLQAMRTLNDADGLKKYQEQYFEA